MQEGYHSLAAARRAQREFKAGRLDIETVRALDSATDWDGLTPKVRCNRKDGKRAVRRKIQKESRRRNRGR